MHHVALGARDVEALAGFYRRTFGLIQRARHQYPDGRLRSIWLQTGDTILMVESIDPARGVEPGWFLAAIRTTSDRHGVVTKCWEPEGSTAYTTYCRDPEGNRIAVSHFPPPWREGAKRREAAFTLFRAALVSKRSVGERSETSDGHPRLRCEEFPEIGFVYDQLRASLSLLFPRLSREAGQSERDQGADTQIELKRGPVYVCSGSAGANAASKLAVLAASEPAWEFCETPEDGAILSGPDAVEVGLAGLALLIETA